MGVLKNSAEESTVKLGRGRNTAMVNVSYKILVGRGRDENAKGRFRQRVRAWTGFNWLRIGYCGDNDP